MRLSKVSNSRSTRNIDDCCGNFGVRCGADRTILDTLLEEVDNSGVLNKSSAVAEMGDRGHNRHDAKTGGCAPFRCGELRPHLTQRRLGLGLPPYQVAS